MFDENRFPQRWLIVRTGAVGDTVLLSSTLRAVRRECPDAWIEVAGVQDRVALLKAPGLADETVSSDRPGWESLFSGHEPLHPELASYLDTFDAIVYYTGTDRDLLRKRLRQRPDQIIRLHPALPPERDGKRHVVYHYLDAFEGILQNLSPPHPRIYLTDTEREAALQKSIDLKIDRERTFILTLHVGAGSRIKQAPPEWFTHCADWFSRRFPISLIVPRGPADERAIAELITLLPKNLKPIDLQCDSLRELASVLSLSDLVIGNDSGVTHIAAALGIPTAVFFLTSDPAVWKPLGDRVRIFEIT